MRASDFQYMRVETEGGRFLGHIFDLRCAGEPEHGETREARAVTELVYGRMGLFERLGISQAEPKMIPWTAVKEIRDDTVIVEDSIAEPD